MWECWVTFASEKQPIGQRFQGRLLSTLCPGCLGTTEFLCLWALSKERITTTQVLSVEASSASSTKLQSRCLTWAANHSTASRCSFPRLLHLPACMVIVSRSIFCESPFAKKKCDVLLLLPRNKVVVILALKGNCGKAVEMSEFGLRYLYLGGQAAVREKLGLP